MWQQEKLSITHFTFVKSTRKHEAMVNEAAIQETDGETLYFLYYTFPLTESDHALDLYHILKRRFDTKEHPLTASFTDYGGAIWYRQLRK